MTRADCQHTTARLSIADIVTDNENDPRIEDIKLGQLLQLGRPRDIRATIAANAGELCLYGEILSEQIKTSARGGRPGRCYYLNEPQALLICMWSNTDKAAAVRKMLIDVFMEYRRGKLEKPIHVREHDRRTSTKVEDALRLKRNIDRLESVVASIQPQAPNFCAMVIDGEHVFVDLNRFGGTGRAVVIDAADRLRIEYIENGSANRAYGARTAMGPWYEKDRGKARDALTVVGMVMEPAMKSAPVVDAVKNEITQLLEAGPFTDLQIAKRLVCAPALVKAVRQEHSGRIR